MRQAFASARTRALVGRSAAVLFSVLVSFSFAAEAAAAKYAAIVVDANTGKTLHSSSADSRRYPASLTKMMTLYLTFEAMQRGKIKKSTPVPFSAQAAAQAPTKIGVKAGGSLTVEQAILSLITRSANDSSVALAELLGGSVDNFARAMTAKARSLGMKGTVFRNPNGLPDTGQFTTARDMATLGIALREHFPQYYSYFSVQSFKYGKQRIANHNRLLGRIKGVDGIKTGYTRASGFNLVSSVTDGQRKIVAVVMGGTSGASRDNKMAELIKTYLPKASRRDGGDLIAKGGAADLDPPALAMLPSSSEAPTPIANPLREDPLEIGEGDAEDTVEDAILTGANTEDGAVPASEEYVVDSVGVKIEAPAADRFGGAPASPALPKPARQPAPQPVQQASVEQDAVDPISTASTQPSGWSIQISSSPSEGEAKLALQNAARKAGGVLASASAYTVTFDKDGTTYYRARFGGFKDKSAAWKACGALKKKKMACYATQ